MADIPIKTHSNQKSIGRYGERVASGYLENKGFSILATNLRLSEKGVRGEIDVLCLKDSVIQLVEVKTVSEGDIPAEINLSRVKIMKLRKLRLILISKLISGQIFQGLYWTEVRIIGLAICLTWNQPKPASQVSGHPISSIKIKVFPDL